MVASISSLYPNDPEKREISAGDLLSNQRGCSTDMTHPSDSSDVAQQRGASSDEPITASDKKLIQSLLWALKPFLNLRRPMPLPFVSTFLMVALEEGKGVNEYARALGMDRSTMSRNLHAIGDRARNGDGGLGLIAIRSHPVDPFRSQVFLTAKGRSIAEQVSRHLRRAGRD